MAFEQTEGGVRFDRSALDAAERRFWRQVWTSVPYEVAAERGIELRDFGPVQATIVTALPTVGMVNLILGATEPEAVPGGHLAAATEWAANEGVAAYVPVTPDLPGTAAAEEWLEANGYARGYAWMKFVRDAHAPRFAASEEVEVVETTDADEYPFGMIAATGFGLPAWAAAFFADLPAHPGWRCYVGLLDGRAQACGAMFLHDGAAELGIAATLEGGRGRGCQLALLRRRIVDAASGGCEILFVETGERVEDRPATSYRNILRAGFEEAYLRPNWQRRAA